MWRCRIGLRRLKGRWMCCEVRCGICMSAWTSEMRASRPSRPNYGVHPCLHQAQHLYLSRARHEAVPCHQIRACCRKGLLAVFWITKGEIRVIELTVSPRHSLEQQAMLIHTRRVNLACHAVHRPWSSNRCRNVMPQKQQVWMSFRLYICIEPLFTFYLLKEASTPSL